MGLLPPLFALGRDPQQNGLRPGDRASRRQREGRPGRSCSAPGVWGQGDTQVHARPAHVRGPRLAQRGPCLHHLGRPSRQVEERRCATGTTQICPELRRQILQTTTFPSRPAAAHDSHLLPNEDHQVDNWLDSRVGWPRDATVPLPAARGGWCRRWLSHSCSLNPRWRCPHTANSGGSAWGRAPPGRRQRRRTESWASPLHTRLSRYRADTLRSRRDNTCLEAAHTHQASDRRFYPHHRDSQ